MCVFSHLTVITSIYAVILISGISTQKCQQTDSATQYLIHARIACVIFLLPGLTLSNSEDVRRIPHEAQTGDPASCNSSMHTSAADNLSMDLTFADGEVKVKSASKRVHYISL